MKVLIAIFMSLLLFCPAMAAGEEQAGCLTFGGSRSDYLQSAVPLSDDRFLLTGISNSRDGIFSAIGYEGDSKGFAVALCVNTDGEVFWLQTGGSEKSEGMHEYSVVPYDQVAGALPLLYTVKQLPAPEYEVRLLDAENGQILQRIKMPTDTAFVSLYNAEYYAIGPVFEGANVTSSQTHSFFMSIVGADGIEKWSRKFPVCLSGYDERIVQAALLADKILVVSHSIDQQADHSCVRLLSLHGDVITHFDSDEGTVYEKVVPLQSGGFLLAGYERKNLQINDVLANALCVDALGKTIWEVKLDGTGSIFFDAIEMDDSLILMTRAFQCYVADKKTGEVFALPALPVDAAAAALGLLRDSKGLLRAYGSTTDDTLKNRFDDMIMAPVPLP